ncbi:MAG: hypothetical protein IJF61_02390 [Clostridia bacterium]|nr:hypothetical protein [Clostridia bacterium]
MSKKYSASFIVGIICVLITVISVFSVINGSFFKIPIFGMVMGETKMDEIQASMDRYLEEFEDVSDEEIEEFENETGVGYKKLKKMVTSPSLNGLIDTGSKLEDFDIDSEAVDMLKIVRAVLVVYGIIIGLFSLLGAFLKKKVFDIIAMIISIPFYVFLVGWLALLVFIVASIAHMVLFSKEKKAFVIAA